MHVSGSTPISQPSAPTVLVADDAWQRTAGPFVCRQGSGSEDEASCDTASGRIMQVEAEPKTLAGKPVFLRLRDRLIVHPQPGKGQRRSVDGYVGIVAH